MGRPSQIHTRAVNLLGGRRLVPALDMLNHSEQPNTRFAGAKAGGLACPSADKRAAVQLC